MAAARFLVSGRVQGVYFRASTRERALALGLDGHARNLADGSVEVIAAGEAAALEALAEWLRHGPPAARVEQVLREPCPEPVAAGFAIG
ncbi:acylphosphatase [Xanthomonas bonasiae]|uniref:acylphosphatase n=1 Tax=Xanthomonas bonasiae TaxID=2810351 RepID=UPI00177B8831|nr:acylphosphatase [Xanthomonas surreyensis]MBD7924437.1 acylphosphatase [Xanthomonas surreyensis]